MAEENLESGQQAGSDGTTNSAVSQNVGDKPTSTFSAEELLKQLEPLIEKKVQSVKDRRFAEQEQFRSEFQPVLERFKDLVSPEQMKEIQKDLEFEDLKRRVYGEMQTSEPASAGNTQVQAVDAAQAIRDAGLDMNDPQVALLATKQYSSEAEVNAAIVGHLKAKRNAPSPTAAQALAESGVPVTQNVNALLEEMKQLETSNNFKAIQAKAQELREAGAPGW